MFENLLKDLDLKLNLLFTFLCIAFVFIPPLNETTGKTVIGIPFMLFLPGYSLIVALFPRAEDLSGVERVALSFLFSIAIVPLLGLVLNYTPFEIRLSPIMIILSIFTILLSLVAWIRRLNLPTEKRFRIPFERPLKINLGQSVLDKVLSIVLIASIIVSCATLVYVVINPRTGERFTEFYLLDANGITSNYPKDLKIGEEGKVIIGIVNHEYENVIYCLEINLNGSLIHEEHVFLIDKETWESPFTFKATEKGDNQKLEFLLYKNQEREAHRKLYLWIRFFE